jgi:hypothetical protein
MHDDTRPGRPAPRAADRQPVPPAMLAAAQPAGATLSPLDSADASFRALTAGPPLGRLPGPARTSGPSRITSASGRAAIRTIWSRTASQAPLLASTHSR